MPRTIIEHEFSIKDIVYLVTDMQQQPRLIQFLKVDCDGAVVHEVIAGTCVSNHFAFELSLTRNIELLTR